MAWVKQFAVSLVIYVSPYGYEQLRCFAVAPLRYARLASAQMLEIMKTEGPQLPKLHKNVRDTMFFCWDSAPSSAQNCSYFVLKCNATIWQVSKTLIYIEHFMICEQIKPQYAKLVYK